MRRREFLISATTGLASALAHGSAARSNAAPLPAAEQVAAEQVATKPQLAKAVHRRSRFGLGFSLYGMKGVPLADAVALCARIGYDCVELPVMAGWLADSARFDAVKQQAFRETLVNAKLRLSAIMENLELVTDAANHEANLERLRAAARIARALAGAATAPPVIETIVGGRPDQWNERRNAMAERLLDWAGVAEKERVTIAVKPHVGGALHVPVDAAWLIERVGSPWIRAAFDFSHFQLRGLPLGACLDKLLPFTAFIHVKDSRGDAGKFQFLLPGEGTIDYREYFAELRDRGYAGDVVVEVSGQIHGKPGYDPAAAAKQSYQPLSDAFRAVAAKGP
ncbi:MAG: L-ribulose-5-phosphate 3-epimerase UlaE [Planctomycetota bacterium]|jgi:sugar phosphate isomerase/epimerase